MSATQSFYRERADGARSAAVTADLDNVRERHLTAAAAWDQMADRLARTERMRAQTDARKAAEREAAAGEIEAAAALG
jgi:hypothetical protein